MTAYHENGPSYSCEFITGTGLKRHRGEPGHTRDTRVPVEHTQHLNGTSVKAIQDSRNETCSHARASCYMFPEKQARRRREETLLSSLPPSSKYLYSQMPTSLSMNRRGEVAEMPRDLFHGAGVAGIDGRPEHRATPCRGLRSWSHECSRTHSLVTAVLSCRTIASGSIHLRCTRRDEVPGPDHVQQLRPRS